MKHLAALLSMIIILGRADAAAQTFSADSLNTDSIAVSPRPVRFGEASRSDSLTVTARVIGAEQVQTFPARGYLPLLRQQAGVVSGGRGELYIRGGRSNETAVYFDGVLQTNPIARAVPVVLSTTAITEVVLMPSFDVETGNANSGIVNVITKANAVDRYSGSAEIVTDAFLPATRTLSSSGLQGFGYTVYNFGVSGPLVPFGNLRDLASMRVQIERQQAAGRNAYQGLGVLANDELSQWNGLANLRFKFGDHIALQAGGFLTSGTTYNGFGGNTRDARNEGGRGALNATLGNYAVRVRNYNNTSDSLRSDGTRILEFRDVAANGERVDETATQLYFKYAHSLSETFTFNAGLYFTRNFTERGDRTFFSDLPAYGPAIRNATNIQGTRPTGVRPDVFGFHWLTANEPVFPNAPTFGYSKQANSSVELEASAALKLREHAIKAGGQIRVYDYRTYTLTRSVLSFSYRAVVATSGPDSGNVVNYIRDDAAFTEENLADQFDGSTAIERIGYTRAGMETNDGDYASRRPTAASLYAKDIFTIGDLTVNAGVRLDYFASGQQGYADLSYPFGKDPNSRKPVLASSNTELLFNPRLYFSLPVGKQTVLHGGLGKYSQVPDFNLLFVSYDQQNFSISSNNPALKSEKTTSYELGVRQQIERVASVDATLFYKSSQDLVQLVQILGTENTPSYNIYNNEGTASVRGLEVAVELRRANYVAAAFNYMLTVADGETSLYGQSHTAAITADIKTPLEDQSLPESLRGWGVTAAFRLGSGTAYSPTSQFYYDYDPTIGFRLTGPKNSERLPLSYQLDMRIDKTFNLFENKLSLNLYLVGINVLGVQNTFSVYRNTGSATDAGFRNTPEYKQLLADYDRSYGAGTGKKYDDLYKQYERGFNGGGEARQFRLGAQVSF